MAAPLGIGVVGIGFGQQVHVPAFRTDRRCSVVAICASRAERAERVAAQLDIPRAYGDWEALIADDDVGAVSIATPPALQAQIAAAALRLGKPVFAEKPLAISVGDARALAIAADEAGIANVVDFEFPEIPEWCEAKRLLDAGSIGTVRHVIVTWQVETYANRMRLASWKTNTAEGGGTLYSFASHLAHNLEWLLGLTARLSASLFRASDDPREGDTIAILCFAMSSGTVVSASIGTSAARGSGHSIDVYGDSGRMTLRNPTSDYVNGFELWIAQRDQPQPERIAVPIVTADVVDGRLRAVSQITRRFVDWIVDGTPTGPTFRDGLRVQELLDAALRSNASRAWVTL